MCGKIESFSKQYHMEVLLNSFHLIKSSHTTGILPSKSENL